MRFKGLKANTNKYIYFWPSEVIEVGLINSHFNLLLNQCFKVTYLNK